MQPKSIQSSLANYATNIPNRNISNKYNSKIVMAMNVTNNILFDHEKYMLLAYA